MKELQRLKALYTDTDTHTHVVSLFQLHQIWLRGFSLILRPNKTNMTDKLLEMLFSLKVTITCEVNDLENRKISMPKQAKLKMRQ